jgi:hypothetical protein
MPVENPHRRTEGEDVRLFAGCDAGLTLLRSKEALEIHGAILGAGGAAANIFYGNR